MIRRAVASFHPRAQPWIARQGYAHELRTAVTVPFALAMLEGGVVGVVSKNIFDVGNLGFAAIFAAPMFANLTSLAWARFSRGRPKARFVAVLMAILLALVASVALLPTHRWGPSALVAVVVLGRIMVAGILTVRSTIWRANFPRAARGRITGKLVLLASLILACWPVLVGRLLDADAAWFRALYLLTALIGTVGVVSFSRIRVRREAALLRHELAPHEGDTPRQPDGRPHTPVSVLRHDATFRGYMVWQFIAGVANMAGATAFVLYVIQLLDEQNAAAPNTQAMSLTATIPLALATLSMPWWSRWLDAMHITRYRVLHGLTWIVHQSLNLIAALTGYLPFLYLASTASGLVRGGGILAWQLGHNDFADRRLVPLYMGIHQTLTGVRGAFAPFMGTFLLAGWPPFTLAGQHVPGWQGIGPWVFAITTALATVSWLGFYRLNRKLRKQGRDAAVDA